MAKLESGPARRERISDALTGAGQIMGTPQYMAPEQIEHPLQVDHRADIYSLGVVFYQMLTGELPIGRFAPPSKKVQIDVRLDEVVLRALEKEPERRYQQASEIKTQRGDHRHHATSCRVRETRQVRQCRQRTGAKVRFTHPTALPLAPPTNGRGSPHGHHRGGVGSVIPHVALLVAGASFKPHFASQPSGMPIVADSYCFPRRRRPAVGCRHSLLLALHFSARFSYPKFDIPQAGFMGWGLPFSTPCCFRCSRSMRRLSLSP